MRSEQYSVDLFQPLGRMELARELVCDEGPRRNESKSREHRESGLDEWYAPKANVCNNIIRVPSADEEPCREQQEGVLRAYTQTRHRELRNRDKT